MFRLNKNNVGFTLVELMVTVAIIGVLASVAIPRILMYQKKARTIEARIVLANIHSLMDTYYTTYDRYCGCLTTNMGYEAPNSRFYASMMEVRGAGILAVDPDNPSCVNDPTLSKVWADKGDGGNIVTSAAGDFGGHFSALTFEVRACGIVSDDFPNGANCSDPTAVDAPDIWSIDENKTIIHLHSGY